MKRKLLLALMLGLAGGAFGLGLARMLELNEPRLQLAETLWNGSEPLDATPMKDREIFDFLGFD